MTINVVILNKTNLLTTLEEPKKHNRIYKCTDQAWNTNFWFASAENDKITFSPFMNEIIPFGFNDFTTKCINEPMFAGIYLGGEDHFLFNVLVNFTPFLFCSYMSSSLNAAVKNTTKWYKTEWVKLNQLTVVTMRKYDLFLSCSHRILIQTEKHYAGVFIWNIWGYSALLL